MSEVKQERLLPLAITRVDMSEACVGALNESGEWVRPEPVLPKDVTNPASAVFQYWRWTELALGPSSASDARPEDRDMASTPRLSTGVRDTDRRLILEKQVDTDVESVFENARRSLGLVRAGVRDLYVKRSTRGRRFLRCVFSDETGREYDWIVPEVALGERVWAHVLRDHIDPGFRDALLSQFRAVDVFVTIGLTKPNGRFPGRFGGCHPLVVGVHALTCDH